MFAIVLMMWEEGVAEGALVTAASVLETRLGYIQKEARPTSGEFLLSMNIDGNGSQTECKTTVNPYAPLKCC